ncbi:hypothetical protein HELRODRAFT_192414 [Helobdella robusta]|uniref:Calponin-homology (CH) domain-containing protein n=1 Tax=Helobdella robusta TaxID=6412 RepID=T1FTX8_HELRO|nr:hypothetical protein HELRODRAFT_192414 [Helobdella robusta]ESO00783.1 hypothetical protein HELRODRAFT_192414 [Helobdella robusta]
MISISSFMSMTRSHRHGGDHDGDDDDADDVAKDPKRRKDSKNGGGWKAAKVTSLAERYNLAHYLEDQDDADDDIEKAEQMNETSTTITTSPTQDLLEWCQDVTRDHRNVSVSNLTTSWRNGMAFCAIIHHFRPELIDFDSLDPCDVRGNCKLAFDAGESLGVPKVIEPSDMVLLKVPDKLSVLTYLFQLKSFFTNDHRGIMSSSLSSTSKPSTRSSKPGETTSNFNFDQYFSGEGKRGATTKQNFRNESEDDAGFECRSPSPYSVTSTVCTSFSPTPVASLERDHNKLVNREAKLEQNSGKNPPYKKLLLKFGAKNNNLVTQTPPLINKFDDTRQPGNQSRHLNSDNANAIQPPSSSSNNNSSSAVTTINTSNSSSSNRPKLMTRKQLLNPFDSDEEDEMNENDRNRSRTKLNANDETRVDVEICANTQAHEFTKANDRNKGSNNSTTDETTFQATSRDNEVAMTDKPINNIKADLKDQLSRSSNASSRQERLKEEARFLMSQAKVSNCSQPQTTTKQLQSSAAAVATTMTTTTSSPSSSSSTLLSSNFSAQPNNDSLTMQEKYLRDQNAMSKRQQELRERARQLIIGAKGSKQITEVIRKPSYTKAYNDSPQSVRSNNTSKEHGTRGHGVKMIGNVSGSDEVTVFTNDDSFNEDNEECKVNRLNKKSESDSEKTSTEQAGTRKDSGNDEAVAGASTQTTDARSQNNFGDCNSPDKSMYVATEMEQLEKEQLLIDERAAGLEWELRRVMKEGDRDETEEKMLKEWFGLVNRKNALIRRQMQLNLLEKEKDLEKKFNLLSVELRNIMALPDWQKTEEGQQREKLLLAELVELVDKRDELVQKLDSQEQAIEDDEKVEHAIDEKLDKRKSGRWRKMRNSGGGLGSEAGAVGGGSGDPSACALQ